eukprot:SAG11_NODE_37688_length_255_cov_1.987179_2_plen_25_part_01
MGRHNGIVTSLAHNVIACGCALARW